LVLLTASVLCGALAVVVSACGGKKSNAEAPSVAGKAERGGNLTLLASSDVDFLDPGRTSVTTGFMVAEATQQPLYRYGPGDVTKQVPGLAASLPVVSDHGREVTVKLRRGVRFSPPVSREVTSADVAYAFDRLFSANVAAPYAPYFEGVVGAPAAPVKGPRVPDVPGVETPDRWTVRFRLKERTGPAFAASLVLVATSAIPADYAKRFDAHSPSTYNEHVVATGPYMVKNDASGRVGGVGYQAGEEIDLVRNPSWSRATDPRPALLDGVRIRTNATDTAIAAKQVLAGSGMALNQPPPASVLKRVMGDERVSAKVDTGGYRLLPLNTTLKPFDDVNVRRAMLAVFDRVSIRLARGGASTGPIATHFLPPGIPGFTDAGGLQGTGDDFLKAPGGDMAVAKKYMQKAGYADGKYHGRESFLLVSSSDSNDQGMAEVAQAQFAKLGFKTRLKVVPADAFFTNWCNVPAKKVLSCASSILWLKDYDDAEPLLRPVFSGESITPTNNVNYSQLSDPRITAAMRAASTLSGPARAKAWGEIDRMIVADAPAVPIQWDVATLIHSKDVAGVANVYFDSWDLTYTGLR
jgi:peptide/nickel transport system substrate-binding protein